MSDCFHLHRRCRLILCFFMRGMVSGVRQLQVRGSLWEALGEGMTRHLGIEYRLIVRINAKVGVCESERMTPRSCCQNSDSIQRIFSVSARQQRTAATGYSP